MALALLVPGLGSSRLPAADNDLILLPPLLVVGSRHHGPAWRYVQAGDLEVLSRCEDHVTRDFLTGYLRRRAQLDAVLPRSLQLRQSLPLSFVLIPPEAEGELNQALSEVMNRAAGASAGWVTPDVSEIQVYRMVRMFPQITLSNDEATGSIFDLTPESRARPRDFGATLRVDVDLSDLSGQPAYSDLTLTLGRVASLIGDRTPGLPEWFKSGFIAFYSTIDWGSASDSAGDLFGVWKPSAFAPSLTWVSPEATRFLRGHKKPISGLPAAMNLSEQERYRAFLPIAGLLSDTSSPNMKAGDFAKLRARELMLFFHWAYHDPTLKRRAALWRLADENSRQPLTPALIERCFGMRPDVLTEELWSYLPEALRSGTPVIGREPAVPPMGTIRNATEMEVARIQGNMGCLETSFIQQNNPDLAQAFGERAISNLRNLYRAGVREPEIEASLGIFEHILGHDAEAQAPLEDAARAHVPYPMVYVILAGLRYHRALAHRYRTDDMLSPEQEAAIMALLSEAGRYSPPQLSAYTLAAQVLSHSSAFTPACLRLIREGAAFYPDNFEVIAGFARACSQLGRKQEALDLLDYALQRTPRDSAAVDQLTNLRSVLAAAQ